MSLVSLTIDGQLITCEDSKTVLDAALENGIYIPHLCHHEDLHPNGGCRLCVVKQEGVEGVVTSCSTKVAEGMVIDTKDQLAEDIRKLSCDFMFKTHPSECTGCPKFGKCQLASISQYVGDTGRALRECKLNAPLDETNPVMLHEMYRCILCGRCVRVCGEERGVGALGFEKIDGRMRVVIKGDSLAEAGCRFCGACVEVCPTGSIRDKVGVMPEAPSRELSLVPCMNGCPANINVPKYIRFIKEGNYPAAAAVVREKAPLPECLGYICVHNCELQCKRTHLNEAISIRNLKRFAASQDDGSWKAKAFHKPATGKRVAVVGSGPAGLTAAYYLAKLGHDTTIYEKLPKAGGQMRYGIPSYRLPREILDKEIAEICEAGVKLICDSPVYSVGELFEHGYDAIFLAIGTHAGNKLPLKNNDLPDVYLNADFLRAINLGEPMPVGENVVVLGGGNVAIDCAGSAVRLGAKNVHMACLEAADKMTASEEEVTWAKEEGITIHNSKTFNEITAEDGKVTGLSITGVKNFYFDKGQAIIEKEENSDEILAADTIIFAVGQHPEGAEMFHVATDRGRIVADEKTWATNMPGVYAAGDCVTGTRSVIASIAAARTVASEIDKYLGGDGVIEEQLAEEQQPSACIGKVEDFATLERKEPQVVPAEERKANFELMDYGLSCEDAHCEAERCLQCDLRLKLAPQKFWSDYAKGGEADE